MMTDPEANTFALLLRSAIPLVVAPLGPSSTGVVRLRGIVRASNGTARIALSRDSDMASGLAVEFPLSAGGHPLVAEAAIDFMRSTVAPDMARLSSLQPQHRDNHMNAVIQASDAGFNPSTAGTSYDHSLFGLFSLLVHGGGFPWFEDVYAFAGFMLRPARRCRIYIRATDDGSLYGVEIPLTHSDGTLMGRFGGGLPQELTPLVRDGTLRAQPSIDDLDDYCAGVVDLTSRIDPGARAR
jgi:hypothetical protein